MIQNMEELKTQLIDQIKKSSKVFIVGHNSPDFDAIGASIGLSSLSSALGKENYIIVDDDPFKIEPGAKKIIDENCLKYHFIRKEEFLKKMDKDSLVIVTDTNRKSLLSIGDIIDQLPHVFVIDHHSVGEDSVKTDNCFISKDASCACEIVSKLLTSIPILFDSNVASYLLAGIFLDTKRFKQCTTSQTHDVAEKLIDCGADIDYVNNLFLEEFDSFCRISNLIISGTIIQKFTDSVFSPIQVSFTLDRNKPEAIYQKEDYAKAADKMMKFNGIDASFALGFIEPHVVHVSARSGKRVNVGMIMDRMQGGGNCQSAGGRYETDDIFPIEKQLMDNVVYGLTDCDEVVNAPKLVKRQQLKKD